MIKVTYVNREPRPTGFSIEGIFKLVKVELENTIDITEFFLDPRRSRYDNTRNVHKNVKGIAHITGDVHFLALGLKGYKSILTIHDLNHLDVLRTSPIKYILYRLFWFTLPLKMVDLVTVVSEDTKQKLISKFSFPEERVRVIYNPVKPLFKYSHNQPNNGTLRILQIGTGEHKNLTNLIKAAKSIDCHLDIIAWVSDNDTKLMHDYGISYTVYNGLSDEQVYERYKACDVLFFASYYEGFGMPIIEAQAVGRPVITSNFGAMREVAQDTAVLVAPSDISQIELCLKKLMTDNLFYDEMVEKGRKNASRFESNIIAENYLEVYKELWSK